MIRLTLVLWLATLTAGANTALGQEEARAPHENPHAPHTFELDFAGGTAAEYLAALRQMSPGLNVIAPVELARVEMQPVKLHGVDAAAAVYLLDEVFHQAGDEQILLRINQLRSHPEASPVYRVTAVRKQEGEGVDSKVWSLVAVIEAGISSDDVLTAVEASLDLFEGYRPARLRFHPETGLLIARAAPSQLETINSIVGELYATHRRTSRIDKEKMDTMKTLLDQAHTESEGWRQKAAEWKTMTELINRELERREEMVRDLEKELQACRMRITELEMLVGQLEDVVEGRREPPGRRGGGDGGAR